MDHPITILIVDDELAGRETLENLLSTQNYNLISASNGIEALTKAAEYLPDLILLDVMMPGSDGYEVCKTLRADPILAEVPIIMVTALDDRASRIHGIDAGADDFVSKPFDRAELRARVRSITRRDRYRRLLTERTKSERVVDILHHSVFALALDDRQNNKNSLIASAVGTREQIESATLALIAISIECASAVALHLLGHGAIIVPAAREIIQIGSTDLISIIPAKHLNNSIEQMLDHFYNHPKVQEQGAILSYGWASGSYPSANAWIEAVARDHVRQRREQMLDTNDEPAILALQTGRRKLLQKYKTSQALFEAYYEELKAQQGRHDQVVQTEIDRLTSIVNHDLNSGFVSLQRAIDDVTTQLPNDAAETLHIIHTLEEYITLCTAWHRSIIELGAGGAIHRQAVGIGPWLAKHLPLLNRCSDGDTHLEINLVGLPDAMVDKQLLLIACLHLLRAVDAAGASLLQISTNTSHYDDRFAILFKDDGEVEPRVACLSAYHHAQREAFCWEYQNLALMHRVLNMQDIEVQFHQKNSCFQMLWIIPKVTEQQKTPFLSLRDLEQGVTKLEQEIQHLQESLDIVANLSNEAQPEDAQTLLLPFVQHLAESLWVMRQKFAPSLYTELRAVDSATVQRVPRLILYCYLLVRNLLLPLTGSPIPVERVNINEQINEVIDMLEHKRAQLEISLHLAPDLPFISIATTDLEQVLMNLIKNASEATKGSGKLHITTTRNERMVVIQVQDTGVGIPHKHKNNIFQLNFSTKGKGTNSGVGLYAVQTIVERAGGRVCVASASIDARGQLSCWQYRFQPDDVVQWDSPGTLFQIEFPIAGES